jgi:hypothetical protein
MSAPVLDAGALIAIDRGDRSVLSEVNRALQGRLPVRTDHPPGRDAGWELLGRTRLRDAIDASVALLAGSGDRVLTSDPWWSIADGADGVPARVRTRGAGTGGDRSIGLGR